MPFYHLAKTRFAPAVLVFALVACGKEEAPKEEKTPPSHKNSVEYTVKTKKLADGQILLTTRIEVYDSLQRVSEQTLTDTLPDLGKTTVDNYSEDGETHLGKTTVEKDYEVFVTALKDTAR